MSRVCCRITGWWQTDITGECHAERARGTVADSCRNFGHVAFFSPQQVFGHRHAPGEQVLHRGGAHCAAEALEECGTGERCLFRQLCNRPGPGRVLVHSSYCEHEAFVGKPAQKAWRCCTPRHGSEGFDEENLQEASQDDITRGPQRARFVYYELHNGGQSCLAANVHELWEERNQQGRVGRAKDAMTHQQSNVRRTALVATSYFAVKKRDSGRIDILASGRLET